MKTTAEAVRDFANAAGVWVAQDPKNKNTKLGWAIQRMEPRIKRAWQDFLDDCEDIRTNNAATDKDGVILKEENSTEYKYTIEGATKRNKEIRARLRKEIEIETYYATDWGVTEYDLTIAERAAFAGFVIPEESAVAEA